MIGKPASVRDRLRHERGAMLIFVAIVLVGVMGILSLALSVGAATRQRRIAQTAADAGAIAGSQQIYRLKDNTAVVAAAESAVVANGFAVGDATVNYPPASGTHSGNNDFVEVIVNKTISTVFGSSSVLHTSSVGIRARGVAGLGSITRACMVALGTSGNDIDVPGDVTATDCGVLSNSSIDVKKTIDAPYVGAVGSVSPANTPHAFGGSALVADPFASLQLPTGVDTVCTHSGLLQINNDTTINAGVYCGGISIKKNITATFNAGTYFIRGGGLSGGEVSATPAVGGVTIIVANGPNNDQAAYRPFVFDNSCFFNVTAPTTGAYKGIAVYVDRNAPSSGTYSVDQVCGQGVITGIVYVPSQTFQLANSNGKLDIYGMLVAKIITSENGGGKYFMHLDTSGNSAIPKRPSLVE